MAPHCGGCTIVSTCTRRFAYLFKISRNVGSSTNFIKHLKVFALIL